MAQPDRELRGLRNDLREVCAALDGRLQQLLEATGKSNVLLEGAQASLAQLDADLVQLHEDLTVEGGLPTRIGGQDAPVATTSSGGFVEVTNPPDVSTVRSAVVDNSETINSTAWAIAGFFVGFMLLGVLYKVVRP